MQPDIVIIGSGLSGLSLACSLADTNLNIVIIEKSPKKAISDPKPDGREIALTHYSVKILQNLKIWEHIDQKSIYLIKKAKVFNGRSLYSLDFDTKNKSIHHLGYLVPNYLIRKAVYEEVRTKNNVKIITNVTVENININQKEACIKLSNKTMLQSKLVVAADSRFSDTRRKMGISANIKDFARTAIVCRMQHHKPNNSTALECFCYGRTLAILPMAKNTSSIVITIPTNLANEILNYSAEEFNLSVQKWLGNKLGKMKLINKRQSYPLTAVWANKFISNRFALIGDAAVGMHPVTAHGFNLGLYGQDALSKEIKNALDRNLDFGDIKILEKYQSAHSLISKPLYLSTNLIVDLFTNDKILAKILRSTTIKFTNKMSPIKNMIANSLTKTSKSKYLPFKFPF